MTSHRRVVRPAKSSRWVGAVLAAALLLLAQNLPAQVDGNYILSPGDLVSVKVFQEDDLAVQQRIAKDGTIIFPLIGQVRIGGKSVAGASAYLAERLRDGYLVNPQVSLSIDSYTSKRFVVLGQVQKPGAYELPSEQTIGLLEAIAMAGGYTRIANPSKITVRRRVGDEIKVIPVNAKALAKESGSGAFEVRSDDTIDVPESLF